MEQSRVVVPTISYPALLVLNLVYSLIGPGQSHINLHPGGSIGLVFFGGTVLNGAMSLLGFSETLVANFGVSEGSVVKLIPDSPWYHHLFAKSQGRAGLLHRRARRVHGNLFDRLPSLCIRFNISSCNPRPFNKLDHSLATPPRTIQHARS